MVMDDVGGSSLPADSQQKFLVWSGCLRPPGTIVSLFLVESPVVSVYVYLDNSTALVCEYLVLFLYIVLPCVRFHN